MARIIGEGTYTGGLEGFPPPGNKAIMGGIYIFTLKDGKIIEVRQEADGLGVMLQLGMELKPKEDTKK